MKQLLYPIIITLVAAAGLFALGYEVSYTKYQSQLEICRRLTQQEASRANQMAALNRSLEERLSQARQQPAVVETPAEPEAATTDPEARRTITLHKGRAVVMDNGKLILVLEDVNLSPRKAAIRVKVQGAGERTAVLESGANLGIRMPDRTVTLVIKNIHASSAVVTLLGY